MPVFILMVVLLCVTVDARCEAASEYYADGIAKVQHGDLGGALHDFDEAIKLNRSLGAAYFHRGVIKSLQNDFPGAIADYTKAIKLNPNYFQAYDSRGIAKAEQALTTQRSSTMKRQSN